jgi:hypothetical protein
MWRAWIYYSSTGLEELSAEYDTPALYPCKNYLLICCLRGSGGTQGPSGDCGRWISFYFRPRFIVRLLGCPLNTPVTVPNELFRVTYRGYLLSLTMFISCWFGVKLNKIIYFLYFICSLQNVMSI